MVVKEKEEVDSGHWEGMDAEECSGPTPGYQASSAFVPEEVPGWVFLRKVLLGTFLYLAQV